jgi:hypothetical protein
MRDTNERKRSVLIIGLTIGAVLVMFVPSRMSQVGGGTGKTIHGISNNPSTNQMPKIVLPRGGG